ncbi:guanylate-binding protein 1-like isoform X3 [Lampetra planeri]
MASPAPATTQQQPPPLNVEELFMCGTSKPLPFIVTDEFGMFYVDPNTAKIIEAINKPLVVVSIVGKYRTGKSFFMNRLAGSNTGFSLGRAIEAKTKGIWVWPRPHPDNDKYLLLLDTEGLGDVQKILRGRNKICQFSGAKNPFPAENTMPGDEHHDMWIFVMAVLMSTTLVWNIMGVLDHNSFEQLNFITNITEHVQTKNTQPENEQELEVNDYFPNFIVCIRDFTLELVLNETRCTADEYMEHSLNPPKNEELRKQREKLCTYLKNRKCFVFQRPVDEDNLKNLENVADDKLRPSFLDAAKEFKEYVLQTSTVKQINSITLTGPSFLTLVEEYVSNSNNPKFKLCIESTLTHVVNTSNKRAKDEAIDSYNKNMESIKTRFPLPVQELCTLHEDYFHAAMELFNQKSVLDREKTHIKELKNNLKRLFIHWTIENNDKSQEKCKSTLKELYEPIQAKEGDFLTEGSIKDHYYMMNDLKLKYKQMENLGDEKNNVLFAFIDEKETMVEKIFEKNALMHEKCKKENEDFRNELIQQKQKHDDQESKINNLEGEVKSQRERAEQLQTNIHAVEVELAGYKAKEPILTSAKEHSEEEREKAEQRAKEAEVELASYKAKEIILISAKEHSEEERKKAEQRAKEAERENAVLRTKMENNERENAVLRTKMENNEKTQLASNVKLDETVDEKHQAEVKPLFVCLYVCYEGHDNSCKVDRI